MAQCYPPDNAGDSSSIPGLGRSPRLGKWQPTPVFLPGIFRGQRSLAGYNPWGHKESDMSEHAGSIYTSIFYYVPLFPFNR